MSTERTDEEAAGPPSTDKLARIGIGILLAVLSAVGAYFGIDLSPPPAVVEVRLFALEPFEELPLDGRQTEYGIPEGGGVVLFRGGEPVMKLYYDPQQPSALRSAQSRTLDQIHNVPTAPLDPRRASP